MIKNGDDDSLSHISPSGARPSSVLAVLRRFPSQWESVESLYAENDSFRDLCEDYRDAVEALRRLEAPGRSQNRELQSEYRALCLHLETEMLRYLEAEQREAEPDRGSG